GADDEWRDVMGILDGRTAIVTGASSGIGRACALRLAEEGAGVIAFARRAEKLNELVREAESRGGKVIPAAGDVSNEADIAGAVKKAVDTFGRIDILANVAQTGMDAPASYVETAAVDEVVAAFVGGPVQGLLFIQKCLPYMKEQGYG